jgi:hypothetical protein
MRIQLTPIIIGLSLIYGCANNDYPPVDKHGRQATNCVAEFLQRISTNDLVGAKALWYGPDRRRTDTNTPDDVKFAKFCERYNNLTKFDLKEYEGKCEYWNIYLTATNRNNELVKGMFGVKIIDNEWRIYRGIDW